MNSISNLPKRALAVGKDQGDLEESISDIPVHTLSLKGVSFVEE